MHEYVDNVHIMLCLLGISCLKEHSSPYNYMNYILLCRKIQQKEESRLQNLMSLKPFI